jgi:curli biogenesis system outer membrane secretion channel CsgG
MNTLSTLKSAASALILAGALAASAVPAAAQSMGPGYVQPLQGPKKSVAVIDVTPSGAFSAEYGSFTQGGGLAAMLETELSSTGQFRMAQRSHLDSVLYEQQLGELGLTRVKTAKAGQLTGAQFLVRAAVTDFSMSEKGGGLSIGGNFGGVLGGLAPQFRNGRVTLDFQVIDSTSGEVVDSFSLTRSLKSRSIAITGSKNGYSVGGNAFGNTPIGQAVRDAMTEASARITQSLRDREWSAQVAQARGGQIYVNVGAEGGLRVGDRLRVQRVVEKITDPTTGALLGMEKADLGQAVVASVSGQYATASFQGAAQPQTGDIITIASR